MVIESYINANLANSVDDRGSISGYAFFLAAGPVSWQSRSQAVIALSTKNAEYMDVALSTHEAFLLRLLLEGMGLNIFIPIALRKDDKTLLSMMIADHPEIIEILYA